MRLRCKLLWTLGMVLLLGRSVGAQPASEFRSISHPFQEVPHIKDRSLQLLYAVGGEDRPLVVEGGASALYTAGVNNILCSLSLPNQTWLGTAFGVKRLDLPKREVQHYTTLDGLPYPYIPAIAAGNGQVFCASMRPPLLQYGVPIAAKVAHSEVVTLCQFNKVKEKWKVLAEEPLEVPDAKTTDNKPTPQIAAKPRVVANRTLACLVPGTGEPNKTLLVFVRLRDGAVERLHTPDFLKKSVIVTTTQMDDSYLWLGTAEGLLRYDLMAKRWEALLADSSVYSSARAEDGSLWLLTKTLGPIHAEDEEGAIQASHWIAVHLVAGQPVRSYPLMDSKEPLDFFNNTFFENLTLAEGRVWWTRYTYGNAMHAQFLYLPSVYSLDPVTGKVTSEVANIFRGEDAYVKVPASVLANSHTGQGLLTPSVMPGRFPGWFCQNEPKNRPPEPLPDAATILSRKRMQDWNFLTSGTTEGGDKALVHRVDNANNKDKEERFVPAFAKFNVHDTASFPVVMNNNVYFLSGSYIRKLRVWDRATGAIETPAAAEAALKQYPANGFGSYDMLPGKGCLWIGTGDQVLRYDIASGHVDVTECKTSERLDYSPHFALLSVEGDIAWVKSAPNHLYIADPLHSRELRPVPLPALPGDLEQEREKVILIALEDHIAWFYARSFMGLRRRTLIGYDLQTHRWTKPYSASLPLISAGQTIRTTITPGEHGITRWFPSGSRDVSAYGYNAASEQWVTLPPVTFEGRPDYNLQLISIDARYVWFAGSDRLHFLDRAAGVWTSVSLPFYLSSYDTSGFARVGDELFIGTYMGLWRYQTTTRQFDQLPPLMLTTDYMEFRMEAMDSKAVWFEMWRASTHMTARFDLQTHLWTYWTPNEGVPQDNAQYFPDDTTCWQLAGNSLYRLDSKTNRWENISRLLGKGKEAVPIRQILLDGKDVWLVTGQTQQYRFTTEHFAADGFAPLYRCQVGADGTASFLPVEPAPGKSLTVQTLGATPNALLLATWEGTYRWDRRIGQWQSIRPPALPAGLPQIKPYAAYETEADFWIVGEENTVRFRKKSRMFSPPDPQFWGRGLGDNAAP